MSNPPAPSPVTPPTPAASPAMPRDQSAIYAEIGGRVRLYRQRGGWTREQLAQRAGMRGEDIHAAEAGTRPLPVHVLYHLAAALEILPCALVPFVEERADEDSAALAAAEGEPGVAATTRVTLEKFRRDVMQLVNNGLTRYHIHWNHPFDGPWLMAVTCRTGDGLPSKVYEYEAQGVRKQWVDGQLYYLFERVNENDTPYRTGLPTDMGGVEDVRPAAGGSRHQPG